LVDSTQHDIDTGATDGIGDVAVTLKVKDFGSFAPRVVVTDGPQDKQHDDGQQQASSNGGKAQQEHDQNRREENICHRRGAGMIAISVPVFSAVTSLKLVGTLLGTLPLI
jgi:hypothetical protein